MPREIISTCVQYNSWLISSARASSPTCSAASHTSPASSRIFLPIPCTPPSRAATVPLPAGRVRARSVNSANRASNVFTGRDCFTPARPRSRGFASDGLLDAVADDLVDVAPVLEGTHQDRLGHAVAQMPGDIAHQPPAFGVVHHIANQHAGLTPVVVFGVQDVGGAHHLPVGRPHHL